MKREGRAIDRQHVNRLSEASGWLMRLQAPERTEADHHEWLRWCDEHPENFAAFETVQGQWKNLDALRNDSSTAREAHLVLNRLAWRRTRVAGQRRWGAKTSWTVAAGLAAIALSIGIMRYFFAPMAPASQRVAAVTINRAATLPDGSKMILGAQSLVNMDFNGPKRQLDLSSGEAYFKVRHDKARPFVVQAGEVSVTAIGTAFDVRRDRDKITVTVEEGTVEVRGSTRDERAAVWRAEAGYQLTYSMQQRTASLASVNPSAALSWRNGELAYSYEPLGSVVEDLNRYSARKILIADSAVAEIRFTGTAFATSLEGWLAGVKQAYPVDIKESSSGEIILTSRK